MSGSAEPLSVRGPSTGNGAAPRAWFKDSRHSAQGSWVLDECTEAVRARATPRAGQRGMPIDLVPPVTPAPRRSLPARAQARHPLRMQDDRQDDSHRRPIAARNLGITQRIAAALVARGASPNGISLAGMAAGMAAGLAFAATGWWPGGAWLLWLLGAVLVQVRLLANLFDGMVALGRGVASPVGELFNEVPDRISDTAVLVGLGVAAGDVALGLAAALAAMLTAYVRTTARSAGAPSDFSGPMAKQQRMALATAVAVWCAVVPHPWGAPRAVWAVLAVITLGAVLTACRRLLRAAAALEGKR